MKSLPKERKPTLINKNNCVKLKNVNYIFDYSKFDKIIIQPFKNIIKNESIEKFENTCNHMFKKVGYGIFVFILNGEIHTYQVFANTTEIKPGSQILTKKKNIKLLKNKKNKKTIKNIKNMGFSNCMINSNVNWWNKLYTLFYYDLLVNTLKNTNITTCFFLNLYDYPVLYKHVCNQHILNEFMCSKNKKENNDYIPVLSGCSSNNYYDKCIVYADAWELVSKTKFLNRGKFVNRYYNEEYKKLNTNWGTKKDELIFRGKNNSCFPNDFEKNNRLKVLYLLNKIQESNKITNKININVGLNSVNHKLLFNVEKNEIKVDISNEDKIINKLHDLVNVQGVSMVEQSNSKYILNIDGYVTAWRLCFELGYNSCIILFLSQYHSWFYDKLKHMKNVYIIDVDSNNLEQDIIKCIKTLERNDNIGKKIANGSLDLFNEVMNFDYIKKYMVNLLSEKEFDIIIDN